jgi:hypothetical protein
MFGSNSNKPNNFSRTSIINKKNIEQSRIITAIKSLFFLLLITYLYVVNILPSDCKEN